jgi:hypothetical protein
MKRTRARKGMKTQPLMLFRMMSMMLNSSREMDTSWLQIIMIQMMILCYENIKFGHPIFIYIKIIL